MKAYTYAGRRRQGQGGRDPADLADAAQKAHEALVEMVAEGNDALLEEFFDKGTLPVEHIVDGLRDAVREMRIFPVLCASALHNIGERPDPEFHPRDIFPSPRRSRPVEGHRSTARSERAVKDSEPVRRSCSRPSPIRSPAACPISR
jgi:elongation factor G